ncbi:hypothetical protein M3201_17330 [Paenibacillus motobuensis]|uniref:hypothetical protein n=1 Tax=Paenibacillus TaxID=44249 RepID=UPI00203D9D1A|nr:MULTISPECIES: hypothetical protein [Paenibacillus]MCM3041458.1 hypothetical protein [Paenibacillus lutimineralis]MCM3648562.1 hypothetical protein [Paenibacillus motobuensis]
MKNQTAFTILLTLNILYGLTLLIYPMMLIGAAFSAGAPIDPALKWYANAFLLIIVSYPLGPILSYFCWMFYKRLSFRWAYVMANLPLLWVLAFIIIEFLLQRTHS